MPSNPGPKLDMDDKTADAPVNAEISGSIKLIARIDNMHANINKNKKDMTPDTTSSSITLLLIFTVYIIFGLTLLLTSWYILFITIISLIILTPPVVEPEDPPIIKKKIKKSFIWLGQSLKLYDVKPVPVEIEIAWNAPYLKDSDKEL